MVSSPMLIVQQYKGTFLRCAGKHYCLVCRQSKDSVCGLYVTNNAFPLVVTEALTHISMRLQA